MALLWQYQRTTEPVPFAVKLPERVSEDKWHVEIQKPTWLRESRQYAWPSFFGPVNKTFPESTSIDRYIQLTEKPTWVVPGRQHAYPSHFGPVNKLFPEVTSADRYYQPIGSQLTPQKNAAYLYPASFMDPFPRTAVVAGNKPYLAIMGCGS